MQAGRMAKEFLDPLTAADEGRDVRQVAMVDVQGNDQENEEIICCMAVGLVNSGRMEESLTRSGQVFRRNEKWREMTSRLFDKRWIIIGSEDLERTLSL